MPYRFPYFPLPFVFGQCHACISLRVCVCARERQSNTPCPNLNATNRRCYDPPETMKRGVKSKMVTSGQCGSFFFFRFKRNGMEKRSEMCLSSEELGPRANVWLEVGWRKVKIRGQYSSFGTAAMSREQAGLCLGLGVPQIMVTTVACES